jgi:hypothetical protein
VGQLTAMHTCCQHTACLLTGSRSRSVYALGKLPTNSLYASGAQPGGETSTPSIRRMGLPCVYELLRSNPGAEAPRLEEACAGEREPKLLLPPAEAWRGSGHRCEPCWTLLTVPKLSYTHAVVCTPSDCWTSHATRCRLDRSNGDSNVRQRMDTTCCEVEGGVALSAAAACIYRAPADGLTADGSLPLWGHQLDHHG